MSSSNSSSVSSLHGSNGVKNTVCRLVFFLFQHRWVPRPGFVLNEYPRWNGNPFHSNGIATWPINSDAITSPPVCPWNARIYNRSSQEFLQYWNRVLLLPSTYGWSNRNQRRYLLHLSGTYIVASNPSIYNKLLRQILVLGGPCGVSFSLSISRCWFPECTSCNIHWQ